MIVVVALLRAKPDAAARVRAAAEKVVPPTHAEAANHVYVLHSGADDPNLFVFYEEWESRAALDEHLQTPHLKAFVTELGDLLAAPIEVHVLDAIAGQTRH